MFSVGQNLLLGVFSFIIGFIFLCAVFLFFARGDGECVSSVAVVFFFSGAIEEGCVVAGFGAAGVYFWTARFCACCLRMNGGFWGSYVGRLRVKHKIPCT